MSPFSRLVGNGIRDFHVFARPRENPESVTTRQKSFSGKKTFERSDYLTKCKRDHVHDSAWTYSAVARSSVLHSKSDLNNCYRWYSEVADNSVAAVHILNNQAHRRWQTRASGSESLRKDNQFMIPLTASVSFTVLWSV